MPYNADESFVTAMHDATPESQFSRAFMAAAGRDYDTGKRIEEQNFQLEEQYQQALDLRIGQPTPDATEPLGPEKPGNLPYDRNRDQPGQDLGLWRQASNWAARKAGNIAEDVAEIVLPESKHGIARKTGDVVEGGVRWVTTQAPAAAASIPRKMVEFYEDMDTVIEYGIDEAFKFLGMPAPSEALQQGAAADAQRMLSPETSSPGLVKGVRKGMEAVMPTNEQFDAPGAKISDQMKAVEGMVFNKPRTPGEEFAREAISMLIGFKGATKLGGMKDVTPAAKAGVKTAKEAARMAKQARLARVAKGGMADMMLIDPDDDETVATITQFFSPDLAEKWRGYIKNDGTKASEVRQIIAQRGANLGIGMLAESIGEAVVGTMQWMKRARLAKKARILEEKAMTTPLVGEDTLARGMAGEGTDLVGKPQWAGEEAILSEVDGLLKEIEDFVTDGELPASMLAEDVTGLGLKAEGATPRPSMRGPFGAAADSDEAKRLGEIKAYFDQLRSLDIEAKTNAINELVGGFDNADNLTRGARAKRAEVLAESERKAAAMRDEDTRPEAFERQATDIPGEATQLGDIARLQDEDALARHSRVNAAGEQQRMLEEWRKGRGQDLADKVAKMQARRTDDLLADAPPGGGLDEGAEELARLQDEQLVAETAAREERRLLDEYLSGQSMDNVADARPVARPDAEDAKASMPNATRTPQDTAMEYIIAQQEKGWKGYNFKAAVRQMSRLHDISPKEAQKLLKLAEQAAMDPNSPGYADMARAANQPVEQTVAEVAETVMNPAPIGIDEFMGESAQVSAANYVRAMEAAGFEGYQPKAFVDALAQQFNLSGSEASKAFKAGLREVRPRPSQTAAVAGEAVEQAPATAKAAAPRGQGAGMRQASEAAQSLDVEEMGLQTAIQSVMRAGKLNEAKATNMLMTALRLRQSPLVEKLANDPRVQKAFGAGATTAAVMYVMFSGGQGEAEAMPIGAFIKAAAKAGAHTADEAAAAGVKAMDEVADAAKIVDDLPPVKEGRPVWDEIHTHADFDRALKEHVAKTPTFEGEGALTTEELDKLISKYNYDKKFVQALAEGDRPSASATKGALDFASQASDEARRLAGEYLKGDGAAETLLRQLDIVGNSMKEAMGLRSSSERPFRLLQAGEDGAVEALRHTPDSVFAKKIKTATSMHELAQIISKADNDDLMKLMNRVGAPTWGGAFKELYYSNILQRFSTLTWNAIGSALLAGENVAERYLAAMVDLIPGVNKGHQGVTFAEANNLVRGYLSSVHDAVLTFGHVMKTGDLPASGLFDSPHAKQITPELFGVTKSSPLYKGLKYMGDAIRLPMTTLGATDAFFKVVTEGAEKHAYATRLARMADDPAAEYARLLGNPTDEMIKYAQEQAKVFTLTNDLVNNLDDVSTHTQGFQRVGMVAQSLNKWKQKIPALNLLVPFVRTGTNSLRFTLERTPVLNLASRKFRADLAMGGAQRELAIAKFVMGGSIGAVVANMAYNGMITGNAPNDPILRSTWLAAHPENAVKVAGTWVPINPQTTLGLILNLGANLGQALGSSRNGEDQNAFEDAAYAFSLSFMTLNESTPILEPFAPLFAMMGNGKYPTDKNKGEIMLREALRIGANAVTPGLLTATGTALDPVQKDLKELNDYVLSKIPGYGAPANLDAWGRKRMMGFGFHDGFVPNTVRFVLGQPMRGDNESKVDKEMLRMNFGMRERKKIGGVDLDTRQGNRLLEIGGTRALAQVEKFIETSTYQSINDTMREAFIKQIYYQNLDRAAAQLLQEDIELRKKVYQTSIDKGNIKP